MTGEVEKVIEDRLLDVIPADETRDDVVELLEGPESALVLTDQEWQDLAVMARLLLAVVGDDRNKNATHARRARLADRILDTMR